MATFLFAIGLIALFFVGMSFRLLFLKKGEFKGTCASQNPYLNKDGAPCSYCGKTFIPGENCENSNSEIDKVMAKFS